jgi:hypothetical protein
MIGFNLPHCVTVRYNAVCNAVYDVGYSAACSVEQSTVCCTAYDFECNMAYSVRYNAVCNAVYDVGCNTT